MHIYFSGVGGAGIGPLAQIAHQAGYTVSGSDKQDSQYIQYLKSHGVTDVHIGQDYDGIAAVHKAASIDWFVYTSALPLENPNAPELRFCADQAIRTSKRDELLNLLLQETGLKLIAIAGTHGKTTTTAMVTWLFKQLEEPVSYLLPAKVSYGEMGEFTPGSSYFIYEADEFDRNFLAYEPVISLITGVSWDHHEIFPTRVDYQQAFVEFIEQSDHSYIWQDDADYLSLEPSSRLSIQDPNDHNIAQIQLKGFYNRLDAWLAVTAVHRATGAPIDQLLTSVSNFPGLNRRMEQIAPGLFSDYAHTPEKIRGAMSVAMEMVAESGQNLVVVYEPLTNRRQHFLKQEYKDCFNGAAQVYWLPSYLAREDPAQRIIPPAELISNLDNPAIAEPAEANEALKATIQGHLAGGAMVVGMVGGGGNSLDDWLRANFTN